MFKSFLPRFKQIFLCFIIIILVYDSNISYYPPSHTIDVLPLNSLFWSPQTEAGPSINNGRVVHVLWRTIIWPLDVSRELFMDGQSFSRHTVSGSLAVLWPWFIWEKVAALIKVAFWFHFINWLQCLVFKIRYEFEIKSKYNFLCLR